jgi:thymine-DNA glycosylase
MCAPPSSQAGRSNLVDSLRPGLILVLIGLNPGIMTAATGHAYAHPSNLFWKLLHSSGITARRHPPSDTHALPALYNVGNTNLCERPTRDGSGLGRQEMRDGVGVLEAKVRRCAPEAVCIVGKSIWETIVEVKRGRKLAKGEFAYGWQERALWLGRGEGAEGSRTYVATTTSGLAAGMGRAEKEEIWKVLGDWVVERRREREETERSEAENAGAADVNAEGTLTREDGAADTKPKGDVDN